MVSDLLAIDTETTGVGWHDEAFMISVASPEFSMVWDKRECTPERWIATILTIEELLENTTRIIMHNAKFDIQKLCRLGISPSIFSDVTRWEDTQAMAHLIDEKQPTGLKHLTRTILDIETDEEAVLKAYRRKAKLKKADGYDKIPSDILSPYAQKDAEFTLALYVSLIQRLPEDLYSLYIMEKHLTLALLDVEAQGMHVDREYVTNKRKEYGDRIYRTKRRIGELAGAEFNPQSHQQVLSALGERGFVVSSTSKDALKEVDDELAGLIIELREANKIKSTYFDALDTEAKDGVLHPNFRQHGTRTGRMSSGSAEA